jgi:hypothetical protein
LAGESLAESASLLRGLIGKQAGFACLQAPKIGFRSMTSAVKIND